MGIEEQLALVGAEQLRVLRIDHVGIHRAEQILGWRPQTALADLLEEIAVHAENHPDWLELTEDP